MKSVGNKVSFPCERRPISHFSRRFQDIPASCERSLTVISNFFLSENIPNLVPIITKFSVNCNAYNDPGACYATLKFDTFVSKQKNVSHLQSLTFSPGGGYSHT